jgi:hypothetical protein
MRFLAFAVAIAVVVAALTTRLVFLQIQQAPRFEALAEANRTAVESIPSTRGVVYDRNKKLLVRNVPTWTVKVRPADLPYPQRDAVVARLAELLEMKPSDINLRIESNAGSSFDLVRIKSDVEESTARLIAEEGLKLPAWRSSSVAADYPVRPAPLADPRIHRRDRRRPARGLEAKELPPGRHRGEGRRGVVVRERASRTYGLQTVERDATGGSSASSDDPGLRARRLAPARST